MACTPIDQLADQTSQAAKHAGQNLTKLISIDNAKEVAQLNYIENLNSPRRFGANPQFQMDYRKRHDAP
ncbi:hypothetical protein [Moraxella lacunata]|uniref:hypothetical protein n=1 Tax=Moraxella lacunata TaxID=477 RepID=UPI000E0F66BF|nr:hypothetical protein [Moraxella lacunata]